MVIDFRFDFLSPYAYLAWTQIHGLARRHGATVRPIPTLFAALLAHGQTRGPAEIPAKRTYVYVDTLRSARHLRVPLGPPPAHPFNPLLALRACCVVDGDEQRRLIDALYAQTWGGQGVGCDTPERVAQAAATASLDAPALLAAATSEPAKATLRQHTDDAIARGVFGVPTMTTGPGPSQFFWGLDALPALERHLKGEENITDADVLKWIDLPQAVSRI
jgi:2-hydroxychromene-2-carboxylate isomerase